MGLVEGVDASDAGNGHFMEVYYRSVSLAAGLDDDEFVDELDNPGTSAQCRAHFPAIFLTLNFEAGTRFVLDGFKSVVALPPSRSRASAKSSST